MESGKWKNEKMKKWKNYDFYSVKLDLPSLRLIMHRSFTVKVLEVHDQELLYKIK